MTETAGTAQNNSYKGQNGSCQSYSHTDEESDIRVQTDGNACGTGWGNAVQVGEGAFRSTQNYSSWTQVKIPITYYNNISMIIAATIPRESQAKSELLKPTPSPYFLYLNRS